MLNLMLLLKSQQWLVLIFKLGICRNLDSTSLSAEVVFSMNGDRVIKARPFVSQVAFLFVI